MRPMETPRIARAVRNLARQGWERLVSMLGQDRWGER